MQKILFYTIFLITILTSCNNLYRAGGLVSLDYPIETPLRSKLIQQYCDSLVNKGYKVPEKWKHLDKLVELDSINHIRLYFKESPEEMYLISFGGMLVLDDVYNPNIRDGSWVARNELMPKEQELRIKKRFKTEILDVIEKMAKRDRLPDSVIYKNQ